MDVSQYLEIFIDETKEHLQNLNTQILDLEQSPDDMDTVNEIFRAAHSLKGMAGTMGYKRMQTLTHDMENVFSKVRDGALKVNSSIIDTIFQCLDALEEYLDNIQSSADEGTNDNENIIKALNGFLNGENAEPKAEEKKAPAPAPKAESTEAPAPAGEGSPDDKWKNINFSDEQIHVMGTAKGKGLNVVGVTVFVQESCILKAARAFLVFKTLEELGEVIISVPSAQDIEDERFELDFSMIIITEKTVDDVINACKGVSEIAKVSGGAVDVPAIVEEEKENETELQVADNKIPQAENAGNTKAPAEKKKPVVNRTVSVGQFAFFKDFGLALCGVFHCNDNVLCADEQIHCAAHAGHFFAGDDPVCKGTLFVNFEAAEDCCINMTAANECERGGAVDEACAGCCCGGAAACINNVERIAVFVRYGAGADGAVLALKDNVNVFGKICGNEGGKTDAEVDNIAVFKFFCNTRCDERLYLSLIH